MQASYLFGRRVSVRVHLGQSQTWQKEFWLGWYVATMHTLVTRALGGAVATIYSTCKPICTTFAVGTRRAWWNRCAEQIAATVQATLE